MSDLVDLLGGVLGHDCSALYSSWDLDIFADADTLALRPDARTVSDLVASFDRAHANWCQCGITLGPAIWRVDLPLGQDSDTPLAWFLPRKDQLLDGTVPLHELHLSQLPRRTIHLIVGTKLPPGPPAAALTSGLRRLGGDLCRVAGSSDQILPKTSHFPDIIHSSGCYYVDRFDWIMSTFGGSQSVNTRIPIIRRPPGFGKTTFLSAYSSYLEDSLDQRQFPKPRVLIRNMPGPLLVFHLDFALLRFSETMSDEELNAECLRFMHAAAEQFHKKYAPPLGTNAPKFSADSTPIWNVKILARKLDRKLFLAIDNYTAPFASLEPSRNTNSLFQRIETAMAKFIIGYILVGTGTGLYPRGLITGTTLPNDDNGPVLPFGRNGLFLKDTQDLTHSPDCAHIIGFTRSDIEELVRSFLGVMDDRVPEVASRVVPRVYKTLVDGEKEQVSEVEATYAPRAVLETLRAVTASGGHDAEWDDTLYLPASASTSSSGSNSSEEAKAMAQLLRTPIDSSDAATFGK